MGDFRWPLARLTLLLACFAVLPRSAWAWGERGHHLIARVAARLIVDGQGEASADTALMTKPFALKDHMLGHLANIPDIMWRGLDPETVAQNGPTHYVDLEYLGVRGGLGATLRELPGSPAATVARLSSLCAAPPKGYVCPKPHHGGAIAATDVGTAPLRIRQLHGLMVAALRRAKEATSAKALAAAVDEALVAGGLLAHFVGDLAQPLHGTVDADGYESGHGGIHGYFETDVVDAYDLTLDAAVAEAAHRGVALGKVIARARGEKAEQDPLLLAYALAMDSQAQVPRVFELDDHQSLIRRSSVAKGLKLPAERRPPGQVMTAYRPLVVERLGLGAGMLAYTWRLAWIQAGRPDLSGYRSFAYALSPAFIRPEQ